MIVSLAVLWAALGLLCAAIVLNRRIREGVVVRVGLSLAALASLTAAPSMAYSPSEAQLRDVAPAAIAITAGLLVAILGWLWRARSWASPRRRSTDFGPLDTGPDGLHGYVSPPPGGAGPAARKLW